MKHREGLSVRIVGDPPGTDRAVEHGWNVDVGDVQRRMDDSRSLSRSRRRREGLSAGNVRCGGWRIRRHGQARQNLCERMVLDPEETERA